MFLPSIRIFTLGDVVLQGPPNECPGFIFSGRVIVKINVPTTVRTLDIVFQSQQGSRWLQLKRPARKPEENSVMYRDTLYVASESAASAVWGKGSYEFYFQIVLPGTLCETMYTEHKRVAYELRATLTTGGALSGHRRSSVLPVAVKRVPYFGSVWESIANDVIHVTAVWRNKIEMCALGCSRVQRDDQPLRVKGVIRALEKGFRLMRVGFILEERTRSRLGGSVGGVKCTSNIAACKYLRAKDGDEDHGGWHGSLIVDQKAFEIELQIPKAYAKIQYDIRHGPVTVSHRLAFVVAVVDQMGRRTSLRLFTPLHIMPHDWVDSGNELPSYTSSFADRVLLKSSVPCQPSGNADTARASSVCGISVAIDGEGSDSEDEGRHGSFSEAEVGGTRCVQLGKDIIPTDQGWNWGLGWPRDDDAMSRIEEVENDNEEEPIVSEEGSSTLLPQISGSVLPAQVVG
ncbi:hypothetical protein GGI15_004016 [Coemansia interrupta]|uniref:Arrestin C-terminal-like domain-containing protein n=1 Tax=Coemansia interrupta TaxID=1126814 RepID=A0A9W8H9X7_9FUNG|nr:hypothetical protein GGI15_004016 [Coemansia interrupta]